MARHPTPRSVVPAHSVAMTGLQTGIYPVAGPGGWQLLGHALRAVYDPWREQPFLIAPGDTVRLEPEEGEVPPEPAARPLLPVAPERPALRVDEAGLLDLVVDGGRHMAGRFGMAQSGPADARAARLANGLVGQRPLRAAARADRARPCADRAATRAHRRHGARRAALDRRPAGRGPDDARPRHGRSHLAAAHRAGRALVPRDRRWDRERALHGQREHRRARPRRAAARGRRRHRHGQGGRLRAPHERQGRLAGRRRRRAHPARARRLHARRSSASTAPSCAPPPAIARASGSRAPRSRAASR